MTEIINDQIAKIKEEVKKVLSRDISDDMAFNYLILKIFYRIKNVADHIITDGKDDVCIDMSLIHIYAPTRPYNRSYSGVGVKKKKG
ncbi:MAG: hypothetical protein K2L50_07730, partial [Bacteroidales bacterium]|nr:hypothetical protein [Bacteroidales bacterium]